MGGFSSKIGENRNRLKKLEKIGTGHPVNKCTLYGTHDFFCFPNFYLVRKIKKLFNKKLTKN